MRLLSFALVIAAFLVSGPLANAQQSKPIKEGSRETSSFSIEVFKSPTCGCCGAWVDHLRENGFQVAVRDMPRDALSQLKHRFGVPKKLGSCHTAKIGPYFVEGHVPAKEIKRLMSEKPKGFGLSVPGMPIGSPGMEVDNKKEPYDVLLVTGADSSEVFAKY